MVSSSVGWSQESWTTESSAAAAAAAAGGAAGGALLLVAAVGGGGGGACCLHERHFFNQIARWLGCTPSMRSLPGLACP